MQEASTGQGRFFAVDRAAWAKVAGIGMNAAVAYLILARGTLRDMRTTSWSTNAIEERTGIARHKAKAAIEALTTAGMIRKDKGGTRPRYFLLALQEGVDPDWIWLPNALTDGADGEVPPVELVRQSQNPAALRLLVDLYHAQGLARDGGVHWRQVRQTYERHRVSEVGAFVVWGFRAANKMAWATAPFVAAHMTGQIEKAADGTRRDSGWPIFWEAIGVLTATGLVEFVGHVVDADNDDGAVVHPYGIKTGLPGETKLASFAHMAGRAMLSPHLRELADTNGLWLLPARAHMGNVQLVGLIRLRYRAQTSATAIWLKGVEECAEWTERYRAIWAEHEGENASLQYQREING